MVHQDNNGQMGLFGEGDESEELAPLTLPKTAPATKQQKLQWEKELLGIYLSEHPLAEYRRLISGAATSIGDIKQEDVGKTVRVMGIITESKSIITKSKQPMVFAKFEDTGGKTEAIVFPTVLAENPSLWAVDKVLLIDGKINDKDGSLKILVDKAYDITGKSSLEEMSIPPLTERANGNGRRGGNGGQYPSRPENGGSYGIKKASSAPLDTNVVLNIKLPTGCVKSLLADIKKAISTHPGSQSVVLLVPQNSHFDKLPISNKVDANPVLLHKLKEIVGNENVILENA